LKLIRDLGTMYPTRKSKVKVRYGIYKCPQCREEIKVQTPSIKRGMSICKKCSTSNRFKKHGLTGTKLRSTWRGMMNRCYNKNAHRYDIYGGSGITVCNEWKTLEGYSKWYKNTYIDGMTMERKDPTLGYNPENIWWKDWKHQASTRRIRSDNKTGFIGVSISGKKFSSHYKGKYLGIFDSAVEANRSRLNYMKEHTVKEEK